MILRRIIAHFRKQEWTAIGIDFMIVVVGVFIGIQVANWNDARADDRLGRFYLERIAEDVRSDATQLEMNIRAWEEEAQHSELIIRYLTEGDFSGLTEWELFRIIYYRAGWAPFAPNKTTYDELVSSGQIRLLGDPDLRREISRYYTGLEDFAAFYQFSTPLREAVRSRYPPAAQRYMWETCFSDREYRNSRDADPGVIRRTLTTLRSDRALIEATQYTLSIRYVAIESAHTDLGHANTLADRIERALQGG